MAINIGRPSVSLEQLYAKIDDFDIINHYFGITQVPYIINSPLRNDNNPSLGFYSKDGIEVLWTDFSTKEGGNIIKLMSKYWGESYANTISRLWEDSSNIININGHAKLYRNKKIAKSSDIKLKCKIREWQDYDLEYWKSFGISLKWLKYADVYPISHKIIIKGNERMVFGCDKLAYAYVEFKDDKESIKIYQPLNTSGFKWSNNHNKSVISLWTKIPEYGDKVVICASLKDALCLMANTGIYALAVQGEGYSISNTAINELKRRFNKVYILLDRDEVGLADGLKLSKETGFINLVLPNINGTKDISDLYKSLKNKSEFKSIIKRLFEESELTN